MIAVVVWALWLIWVGQYILYTRDGAKLDFSFSGQYPEGELAVQPSAGEEIEIIYNDPIVEGDAPVTENISIRGYYIDFEDLQTDISAVRTQLEALPAQTAVLLDMKNIKGFFHYSTAVGTTTATDIDIEEMDALLEYLASSDLYTIARIPAFRDWEYGLNNVSSGLPYRGKDGALWIDDQKCYWLDPTSDDALTYLMRITLELRTLGFDEVVFDDFRFPETDKIVFKGDKAQALADAATTMVASCATEWFCVSFFSTDYAFPLPEGNARLYVKGVEAEDIKTVAGQVNTDDPTVHLLFLTEVHDTRFNEYCVLRPLDNAH